jgi:hypothetical protein
VPESHHLNCFRLILYTIVKVIPNPTQMDTPYAGETYVRRDRSDMGLCRDELESLLDGFTKGVWSGWPVQIPP